MRIPRGHGGLDVWWYISVALRHAWHQSHRLGWLELVRKNHSIGLNLPHESMVKGCRIMLWSMNSPITVSSQIKGKVGVAGLSGCPSLHCSCHWRWRFGLMVINVLGCIIPAIDRADLIAVAKPVEEIMLCACFLLLHQQVNAWSS